MKAGMVVAGVTVATGLTVLNNLLHDNNEFRPVMAGFIVGTMLLILAMFNTPIAAALAMLLLATSIMANAIPILSKVNK